MLGAAFVLSALLGLGCAVTQTGATAADLDRARGEAGQGATTFAKECARCHGQRGEGLAGAPAGAPAILGVGALPEYPRNTGSAGGPTMLDPQQLQIEAQTRPAGAASRDSFRNAQDLYNFISTRMPRTRPGQLKQDDYWAVVSYLLAAQGATLPAGGVGPASAISMPIPRR